MTCRFFPFASLFLAGERQQEQLMNVFGVILTGHIYLSFE
jgi:hypothetical protein